MIAHLSHRRSGRRAQQGISLVMTLLFMVSALVLGISVMSVGVMQERILGNSKDRDLAFQAAEAALREAEADIVKNITDASAFVDTCASGLCTAPTLRATVSPLPVDQQAGFDWAVAGNVRTYGQYTTALALPSVTVQPVYVIEKLGNLGTPAGESLVLGSAPVSPGVAYRITARATGARSETAVTLQTVYATR